MPMTSAELRALWRAGAKIVGPDGSVIMPPIGADCVVINDVPDDAVVC